MVVVDMGAPHGGHGPGRGPPEARDGSDASHARDVPDGPEASHSPDAPDAWDTSDARDASDGHPIRDGSSIGEGPRGLGGDLSDETPSPAASTPESASRSRRRPWIFFKWLLLAPMILLATLVCLVLILPRIITAERVRRELVSALTERLGVEVSLEGLEYHPLTGVELVGLKVGHPDGFERNILEVDAARVAYAFSLRPLGLTIREVALVRPRIAIETKDGVRALDRVLAHLARARSSEEASTPEPAPEPDKAGKSTGPVTPVALRLEALRIGPVEFDLVDEDRLVSIRECSLAIERSHLDPESFAFAALVECMAERESPNVVFRAPGAEQALAVPAAGGRDLLARTRLTLRARADGGASKGLTPSNVEVRLAGEVGIEGKLGETSLAPLLLSADLGLSVGTGADSADAHARIALDGTEVVDARAVLSGLHAAIVGLAGVDVAAGMGVFPGGAHDLLEVDLPVVALPFGVLDRYVRAVVPGLALSGSLSAQARARGSIRGVVAGAPDAAEIALTLDEIGLRFPSANLDVEGLSGRVRVVHEPTRSRNGRGQEADRLDRLDRGFEAHSNRGTTDTTTGRSTDSTGGTIDSASRTIDSVGRTSDSVGRTSDSTGRATDATSRTTSFVAGYRIEGSLDVARLSTASLRLGRGRITLDGSSDGIALPRTGRFATSISARAEDLDSPSFTAKRLDLALAFDGVDPLDPARSISSPVTASVAVDAARIRAAGTRAPIDLVRPSLRVRVSTHRLIEPSDVPVLAAVRFSTARAQIEDHSRFERLIVTLEGPLSDPRWLTRSRPLDADLRLGVDIKEGVLGSVGAAVEGLKLRLGLGVDDVEARKLSAMSAPAPLPRTVDARLSVAARRVEYALPKGSVEMPVSFEARADANLALGAVRVSSLTLSLGEIVRLEAHGRGERVLDAGRLVDASVEILPIDLERALSILRPALGPAVEDLQTGGRVSMSYRIKGRPSEALAFRGFDSPLVPLEASASIVLADVFARSSRQQLSLEGASGRLSAEVKDKGVEVLAGLRVDSLRTGLGGAARGVRGAAIEGRVAFRERIWRLSLSAGSDALMLGRSVPQQDAARSPSGRPTPAKGSAAPESGAGGGSADPVIAEAEHLPGARIQVALEYPLFGDVSLRTFDVAAQSFGLDVHAEGSLSRRKFGVFEPNLSLAARVDFDRLKQLRVEGEPTSASPLAALAEWTANASGTAGLSLRLRPRDDRELDVEGEFAAGALSHRASSFEIVGATGRIPVVQRLVLPVAKLDESASLHRGALGDDLEARLAELTTRLVSASRVRLDASDILVEPPKTADYDALRPYQARTGPRLTAVAVKLGSTVFEDVILESTWRSGVFRIDRFASKVFEGDILADLAFQVTSDRDVRLRLRATMTRLNFDIPYALAKGERPVSDPDEKAKYSSSGTLDLKFGLKERTVSGRIDLENLSTEFVQRLLGAIDPKGSNSGVQKALTALESAELFGVRPVRAHLWISQNLLNLTFDFERLWLSIPNPFDAPLTSLLHLVMTPFRVVTIPLLGGPVIATVNSIRNLSVSNILEPYIAGLDRAEFWSWMEGRVAALADAEGRRAESSSSR